MKSSPTSSPVAFIVEGIPAPQGSKRHVGGGRMVESSKRVAPWRAAVAAAAREAEVFISGPVMINLDFRFPRPKRMKPKDRSPMVQRPDLDKLIRSTLDGLTGVAFTDDSQVVKITATKQRCAPGGGLPGATITITEAP